MANQLKMAMVNAILTLKQRGWSGRRIARELGIDRETVACYVHLRPADAKPATHAPTGSETQKPADAPLGSEGQEAPKSGPQSQCESFRKVIEDKLKDGLTCQRIYQDLAEAYGFEGSYYSVRRSVRRLREDKAIPFRRTECLPGEESQIDLGTGAPVVRPDRKRKHPHVLRVVLSFSRKGYSEAVLSRSRTGSFITPRSSASPAPTAGSNAGPQVTAVHQTRLKRIETTTTILARTVSPIGLRPAYLTRRAMT